MAQDGANASPQVDEAYRTVAERSPQGLMLITESRVIFANAAAARLFGYDDVRSLLVTPVQDLFEIVHPDDRARMRGRLTDRFAGRFVSDSTEFRLVRADGTIRWIESHLSDVIYRGEPALQIAQVDITARREAERALRESEALYRQLVDQAPVGIIATDAEGNLTSLNPAALAILGSPSAEASKRFNVFRLPTIREAGLIGVFEAAVATRQVQRVEGHYRSLWGRESDVSFSVSPLLDDEGRLRGMLAIIEDVTERRRAEAVRSALLELARDVSGTLDPAEILRSARRCATEVFSSDGVAALAFERRPGDEGPASTGGDTALGRLLEERVGASAAALAMLRAGSSLLLVEVDGTHRAGDESFGRLGVGPVLLAPLPGRGPLAALAVWRRAGETGFAPADMTLFEGIARQVALALGAAELHRAQQEEARIAGALARVGQELISVLSEPALLHQLCRVTAEVLECDRSMTVLLDAEAGVWAVVACFGESPERWEAVREMRMPASFDRALTENFRREQVVEVDAGAGSIVAALARDQGVSRALYIALRRGDDVIGLQTAELRRPEGRFGAAHKRIARGIGQLASLALEDARLMSQLERASRLKSEFVATMSHELRTPLHIILGYNDLILDGAFGDLTPDQRDGLERADRNARSLLELINATLDMSRLEAGRLTLDLREVAVADVVAQVDLDTRDVQAQSGLAFSWIVAPDLPTVYTDPAKLKTILRNLVGNAVKFTPRGSVAIEAVADAGGVAIAVRDTGVGIPEEQLREVFEPFLQLDPPGRASRGGVGLGLYIVSRLLDELGGSVGVESWVGEGSTFRVWIPMIAKPTSSATR
jgi:PAS domain S-box-containing protein